MTKSLPKETVVLLHGILRSKLDMLGLESFLKKNNYAVINIVYPSREKSLEDITDFVTKEIENSRHYNPETTLHFVTHSMGGLIARYFIATHKPKNLGKVVMLSPPNSGSEFADFFSQNEFLAPIYKTIFGPAGAQLTTAYKHIDEAITFPLGIIAGNASINPLAPWILSGEHDGIVPVERTKIEGMADHITLKTTHSFMMFNESVMKQTLAFLQNGKFDHPQKEKSEKTSKKL